MKLKITIEGPPGSGKTIVGRFILGVIQPLIKLYAWQNDAIFLDEGQKITPQVAEHYHVVIVTKATTFVNASGKVVT